MVSPIETILAYLTSVCQNHAMKIVNLYLQILPFFVDKKTALIFVGCF